MRRLLLILLVIAFGISGVMGCAGLSPMNEAGKPKVTLDRVEIQSYFPWTDLPANTPLGLAFILNVDNPSGQNIMLDNIKFTVSFEAAPGKYIEITTPTVYDRIYFAPKTTSQYRVVNTLGSGTIRLTLLVAQAPKVQELKLNPADLIKDWYNKVGDFKFGIKVHEGMAVFQTDKGENIFVPFEGTFPKK